MPTNYPLAGRLIDGGAAFRWLSSSLDSTACDVDLCSAFVRSEALSPLLQGLAIRTGRRRLLVRWRLADFLAGASDFEAYDIAKRFGFQPFMRLDFHGKAYVVPPIGVLVGSANATLSGFDVSSPANEELCTLVPCNDGNQGVIDALFVGATAVDDLLLEDLKSAVALAKTTPTEGPEWPPQIMNRLVKPRIVETLLVDECFWRGPAGLVHSGETIGPAEAHDRALLGLGNSSPVPITVARSQFLQTAAYRWLLEVLERSGGEAYFGQLTEALHNSLLDDPLPSRRGVKELLQNLLSWIEALAISDINVDRPRHSQRVRLL